ncbi:MULTISPECIES: DUF3955 domain-containing protein [Bacillus cereus group]|uniref:DUF3955 domain-containing protein n=1 Tax=Bacillus mycoides TaxID=1405 RepID=A0AAP8KWW8_BACMY|nr:MULTISPECIES: DUF3955 domain-containing protein [Bacillus cereus group]AJH18480.1 hypothetical protein BG05_948 [Bacillus mycoides]EJS09314.1 hypothetical protein IKM_00489 [Bacillus mycoides]EOO35108.1 hypothetical protein IKK_05179 [Bacillus mycoides]KMQ21134.1 hypothetical protein TU70_01010 [Bacillus mycoides]KUH43427.1 hypothetical protein M2E15_6317 [Bacillus mycoides]
MKNKFLLAIVLISLGVTCLLMHGTTSKVADNGLLVEPFFFLVPVSYLLFFSSIGVLLVGFITSKLKKQQ